MPILFMRLFYGIYFLGSTLIVYHLLSRFIFKRETVSLPYLRDQFLLILFWPLALISRPGRKKLLKLSKKI